MEVGIAYLTKKFAYSPNGSESVGHRVRRAEARCRTVEPTSKATW